MELNEERLRRPRRAAAGNLLQDLLQHGLDAEEEAVLEAYDTENTDSSFSISTDEETVDEVESDFSEEELSGVLEDEEIEPEETVIRREERKERAAIRKKKLEKAFGKTTEKKDRKVQERKGSTISKGVDEEEEDGRKDGQIEGEKAPQQESEESTGSFHTRPVRRRPPPTIPFSTRMADALSRAINVKAALDEQQQQEAAALLSSSSLPVGTSLAAYISPSSPLSGRSTARARHRRARREALGTFSSCASSGESPSFSSLKNGPVGGGGGSFSFSSYTTGKSSVDRGTMYMLNNRRSHIPIYYPPLLSPDFFPRVMHSSTFSSVIDKSYRDVHVVNGNLFSTYSAEWLSLLSHAQRGPPEENWDFVDDTASHTSSGSTSRSGSTASTGSSSSSRSSRRTSSPTSSLHIESEKVKRVKKVEGKFSRKRQRSSKTRRKRKVRGREESEEEEGRCGRWWWWEEMEEDGEGGGRSLRSGENQEEENPSLPSASGSLWTTPGRSPYPPYFSPCFYTAVSSLWKRDHHHHHQNRSSQQSINLSTSSPLSPSESSCVRRGRREGGCRGGGAQKSRGRRKTPCIPPFQPAGEHSTSPSLLPRSTTGGDASSTQQSRLYSSPSPPLPISAASFASLLYFEAEPGVISQHDYRTNFLYTCARLPAVGEEGSGGSLKEASHRRKNFESQFLMGQRITVHKSKTIKEFTKGSSSTIITFSDGLPPCFSAA